MFFNKSNRITDTFGAIEGLLNGNRLRLLNNRLY